MSKNPKSKDPDLVETYSAHAKSGGGYVWDEVIEYRVWCHAKEEGTKNPLQDQLPYPYRCY